MKRFAAVFVIVFMALPAFAQEMAFPLACQPGANCWIIGYPDMDEEPGKGADYACGPSANDGDVFLRLGLADTEAVLQNMPVLAAADGVVKDASDNLPDLAIASRAQLKTGTANCGNGIIIDHGGGIKTAYCHLRANSIRAQKGSRVHKGDVIAFAGQSGLALWPQLGFAIQKDGYFIDPVTGRSAVEGCGFKERPVIALPAAFMTYQPAAIVALGFAPSEMSADTMARGKATRFAVIGREEKTITMWGLIIGLHKGDRIETRIRDPRGRTFSYQDVTADEDRDRLPINVGRSRGYIGWRAGPYRGEVTITRETEKGPVSVSRQVVVIVE